MRSVSYSSPGAFRKALTDRLREEAQEGPWSLHELQRQMAYDRLLERLYLNDQGWVVKGATALLARGIGVRGTVDVDLYRDSEPEIAESDLRSAAEVDLGDWFRFELGRSEIIRAETRGLRIPVNSLIGITSWVKFRVDIVGSALQMTGSPEPVPPLARVAIPDVSQHGYRAYPLVDHVADKVAALMERIGRMPSTRFKDLVDLVAIVTQARIPAKEQMAALKSEAARRGFVLPERLGLDATLWETGYAAAANRSLLSLAHSLDDALAVVGPFLDPLLAGSAAGIWDPGQMRWSGAEDESL